FDAAQRTWKLCLQSAMLGLGAVLVLQDALSAGAMVAATILLVRAMGPVDVLAAHWPIVVEARKGWRVLADMPKKCVEADVDFTSRSHRSGLSMKSISLVQAGQPALAPFDLTLEAGEVLGVIGASGAGKSELLKTLASHGNTEDPDRVAQDVMLLAGGPKVFTGSVAQNLVGFQENTRVSDFERAAIHAGISADIARLKEGAMTDIKEAFAAWPKAVQDRLQFAQALYDPPSVLLLDDPYAAQPPEGAQVLNALLERRSKAGLVTVFTAQHPTALTHVSKLLWLDQGRCRALGPRDSVLARFLAPRAADGQQAPLDLVS
ncbi:ATP-binding cassette domain-containing protein, partial [Cognatishimia sp.]|uniref:ATP-binding cassette domain-containing protein n=1 Tax=Cognatishimia sp. TaxID=2211648 RepID=UPI0035134B34